MTITPTITTTTAAITRSNEVTLSMQRRILAGALILADMAIITIVPFVALFLRFEGNIPPSQIDNVLFYLPAAVIIQIVTFYFFGLYHRLWRYASVSDLLMIGVAVTVGSILVAGYASWMAIGFPRSLYVFNWLLTTLFIGTSRMGVRILRYILMQQTAKPNRVLIIGAGDAGAIIAREILQRYHDTKTLVGFIDDSPLKQHQLMYGAKVLGTTGEIEQITGQYKITEIIIAMPSVGGSVIREIVHTCKHTGCDVKILPGVYELIDGQVTVQQLRKVELEDLLGRDPVQLDLTGITGYIGGKVVLITGAGGSIGSELCRQIAKMHPKQLLLLGKGENSIYEIHQELSNKYPHIDTVPIIADIRDKERINSIFGHYRPQVVFHAAAHKHVPLMEAHPVEAVKNNIFGTKNVAEAADRCGSEIFIMISTDKAVNPTSVMVSPVS